MKVIRGFHECTFSKSGLLALTPYLVTRLFFYVGFVYLKYLDQQENTSIFVYIDGVCSQVHINQLYKHM